MYLPNRSEISFPLNQDVNTNGLETQLFQFWYPGSSYYIFNPSKIILTARMSSGTSIILNARLVDLSSPSSATVATLPTTTIGYADSTLTTTTLVNPPTATGANLALLVTTSSPNPISSATKVKLLSFYMLSSI